MVDTPHRLTADERHALALAPLPVCLHYGGRQWGGVYIRSNVPQVGRRTFSPWWADDEIGAATHPDEDLS